VDDLRHDDLRAYQRHLAGRLKGIRLTRTRARGGSLVAALDRKGSLIERDLSNGITLPKLQAAAAQADRVR
jgi:hypothetical protein